ncbi:unnamed protein product [Parnassius apollo]|uniref:(apollo) hypothetical protein n=1 Tax=Parnassius apollo TaxID=110799 RepID=A0A8S3WLT9_PARAO|nr:unnamed protein product [Parnassius apollo]
MIINILGLIEMLMLCLFCVTFALCWTWWHRNTKSKLEPPAYPGALPLIGHTHLLMGDSVRLIEMLMLCLFCVTFALCWTWWHRNTKSKLEPPAYPGALPLIGHTHLLMGDSVHLWNLVKQMSYTTLRMGGVIAMSIGLRTIYVLTDPEDSLTVANACLQKDTFYEFAKPWLGEGLVTGTVSIWKRHRKLLSPAFSQPVLDGFQGVFNSQSRRLVKDLEVEAGKGPFDHWVYMRRNALETICLTTMGVDFRRNSILYSQCEVATEQIFSVIIERLQKFWLHNDFIYSWSSLKKKQDQCLRILHNISYTVLQERKASYLNNKKNGLKASSGTKFKAFLDLLLELSIETGTFNDLEIREEVDTMIAAGHESTATVLMFTLVLIGSYPKVQERLFEELHYVFGEDDRDVTKQDLSRLEYLEAVLKESMRIYPIVALTVRILDKNVKLKNYTLTAGRPCIISLYGIHRHPTWGDDAEEFKPERWLDTRTLPSCSTAFAAFNMGRRICIGKSFAFMSMKTTLAHVLRHYRVKGDHTKMEIKADVLLKPVYGHHISIERRTK